MISHRSLLIFTLYEDRRNLPGLRSAPKDSLKAEFFDLFLRQVAGIKRTLHMRRAEGFVFIFVRRSTPLARERAPTGSTLVDRPARRSRQFYRLQGSELTL
jgi:hypothetical protein